MRRMRHRFVGLVLLAVFSAGGCGGGGGGGGGTILTGEVELVNSSRVDIGAFFLSPASQSTWGPDILGGSLPPGYLATFLDVPPGVYDARADVLGIYSDYFGYFYGFSVFAGGVTTVTAVDSSFTGSLEVTNGHSTASILAIYLSPASASTWGPNQITLPVGPGGSAHINDIPPGLYDLMAVWNAGPDSLKTNLSIVSLTLLTQTLI